MLPFKVMTGMSLVLRADGATVGLELRFVLDGSTVYVSAVPNATLRMPFRAAMAKLCVTPEGCEAFGPHQTVLRLHKPLNKLPI